MSGDWRNELATKQQMEKLRFFGCTWDEGITAGQASDALEECAKQFPDAEAAYQKAQPATEKQKEKLRFFGCTWDGDINMGQASDALAECASQFPDREAMWQLQKRKSVEPHITFPDAALDQLDKASSKEVTIQKNKTVLSEPVAENEAHFSETAEQAPLTYDEVRAMTQEGWNSWIALHGSYGTEPGHRLTYGEARGLNERAWDEWRVRHGRLSPREDNEQQSTSDRASSEKAMVPKALWCSKCRKSKTIEHNGRQWCPDCGCFVTPLDVETDVQLRPQPDRYTKPQMASPQEFPGRDEPVPRFGRIWPKQELANEVTIQEAAKPQNKSPSEYTIPAREVQDFLRCHPAIQKPATYISNNPIERFTKWLDIVLERNNKCLGGHWLPVGPVVYPFKEYTTLTKGLCVQIADAIESRGYCVEPDARFGSGKYEKQHTLALFKPFDGDPIHPSTAYLGAANLLRLCILITTADGQIDPMELEVFHRAIENLAGLSLTDHKRLLILEQLLAQELSSASKTAPKIAKSVPADKRLVIGKLLVEVAAANNFITDGERRALAELFKILKIPPAMLEKLAAETCPWPRQNVAQDDVSDGDKERWNQWRIDHPGVVIDDFTLAEEKWNFNDWKTLNARWHALHECLVARQKQLRIAPEASSRRVSALENFLADGRRLGTRGKKIPEPIAVPAPKTFALDPDKIHAIQNDTKEVTAILSIVMEDESEESIASAATITLPAPEIPKVSSGGNAASSPTQFKGLDAAFHPILERLLARDSWPKNDFKSLADEFHFMPLNIRDTLNEWSDEMLGDFILDGDDPVVVRRELIGKETIYG